MVIKSEEVNNQVALPRDQSTLPSVAYPQAVIQGAPTSFISISIDVPHFRGMLNLPEDENKREGGFVYNLGFRVIHIVARSDTYM